VYLTPEGQGEQGTDLGADWIPTRVDPGDPFWKQVLEDEALLAEEQGLS